MTRFNLHPIIKTLAMQYVLLGITRLLRPTSGGTVPEVVIASVEDNIFGMPMPVLGRGRDLHCLEDKVKEIFARDGV